MAGIKNKIKWAYQRVVRGYDDRIFWGFDGFFQETIMPPLKQFCQEQLEQHELMSLNPKRKSIYRRTLALIDALENEEPMDFYQKDNIGKLAGYFGKNIGYYWD